jgi:hypothetical protein
MGLRITDHTNRFQIHNDLSLHMFNTGFILYDYEGDPIIQAEYVAETDKFEVSAINVQTEFATTIRYKIKRGTKSD